MTFFLPVLFLLVIDIFLIIYRLFKRIFSKDSEFNRIFIRRIKYITYLFVFILILYGLLIGNRVNNVKEFQLTYQNLPEEFDGFRLIQVTDIHIGSIYGNQKRMNKLIDKINELSPDLFVFTGDMVNFSSNEIDIYQQAFENIESHYGKYAVLGNHDYGDYVEWNSYEDKIINLEKLKEFYKKTGFQLLLNDNQSLTINNQSINIIGVENWGKSPFPQYGNLGTATMDCNLDGFDLLLSHDPSFWKFEVDNYDIELTLSGHTHGFQLGFDVFGHKWSPSQYFYEEWKGLYGGEGKYLYVNTGWGVIGYLGRIGFFPEITVIELKCLK